jgi:hypothetical protein
VKIGIFHTLRFFFADFSPLREQHVLTQSRKDADRLHKTATIEGPEESGLS